MIIIFLNFDPVPRSEEPLIPSMSKNCLVMLRLLRDMLIDIGAKKLMDIGYGSRQAKIILQNGTTVLRIRIRDTGSGGFLTPAYGIGKKSKSGSRIWIRDDKPGSYF
jgi:hypothetical protein